MKQAQAMQDNLKKAQDELANVEVEGESGAGLVKVVMTCKHDVKRVTIDPSLLQDDKDMLEDLVAATCSKTWWPLLSTLRCARPRKPRPRRWARSPRGCQASPAA